MGRFVAMMVRPGVWAIAIFAAVLTLAGRPALAQGVEAPARVDVEFSITQTTTFGQSVFVLGDLPELGGNVMTRAVKLVPTAYPVWRVKVSLSAGRVYTYRYVVRSDGAGQTSNAANGTFVTSATSATAPSVAPVVPSKVLLLTWNVPGPAMFVRVAGSTGAYTRVNMAEFGPAASGRTGEKQWLAWGFLGSGLRYEFYFTGSDGVTSRYPAAGAYTTSLDGAFVQDGQVYSYVPAAAVTAARRNYSVSSVPTIFSPQLNETRGYRVFLPRGYDQHAGRRYPVLYMHDGQNVFEAGSFGSWNAAGTLINLQAAGLMREVIVVALDNGPNRLRDYLPPSDVLTGGGRGDLYLNYVRDTVKPLIDTQYRTLPGPEVTGILGSSMGGVISLYAGWDYTGTFTRTGLMSGAWQTCPNFLSRVRTTPARAIRMFLDSGDSGTSSDNYGLSYSLRDYFADQAAPKYAVEGSLRHVVGYGQQHNEAAWSQRLPDALTFLYPAAEEPNTVLREVFGSQWDVNADARVDAEDLYGQGASARDLNFDGVADGTDATRLEAYLRRGEAASMAR